MKRCITALSSEGKNRAEALDEICEKLGENGGAPILLIFSSGYEDIGYYSMELYKRYPSSNIMGTTSCVNFSSAGMAEMEKALSVLAVYEGIECSGGVLLDVRRCPIRHIFEIERALEEFPDTENCCCLEFMTALSMGEELVLDTFKQAFEHKNIPVFGSSSGVKEGTFLSKVSFNGKVYDEACVFVIIKNLHGKIYGMKEDIYKPTKHRFTATSVDFDEMALLECDGKPAAPYMASLIGITIPELAKELSTHPIGRINADEIYIAQPGEIRRDGSITFRTHIYNYTPFVILEPENMSKMQDRISRRVREAGFEPSFTVCICCVLMSEIFTREGNFDTFTDTLKRSCGDFIGFSGYGEQMKFVQHQKTVVLLMFE